MFTSLRVALSVALTAFAAIVIPVGVASASGAHTNSILVKVKPGAHVKQVAKRHAMSVRRNFPQIHWVELESRAGGAAASAASNAGALAGRLESDSAVRAVDRVQPGEQLELHFVPRDPLFDPEIVFSADGTQIGWHFVKPNFPIAWNFTQGHGAHVAVIDSEFDLANPDLGPKVVQRYNVASGTAQYRTNDVALQTGDAIHGSHTAGLVGAMTDNGQGVAGGCFECGIVAIKIGSEVVSGTSFVNAKVLGDMVEGVLYAANTGASVISMSLGVPRPHQPLLDAINNASANGKVIVASAGNSGPNGEPSYPAAYPNVIGVGATDRQDEIASFSTQGNYLDIAAPGVEIVSTTNAKDEGAFSLEEPPKVAVAIKSGTSMSAPIVAGLAALMRSVRPDLTPAEVENLIKATATDLGFAGPDPVYGAGLINAAAAVEAAIAYVRPAPPPPPPAPAPPRRKKVRKIGARVVFHVRKHKGKYIYFGRVKSAKKCQRKRTVLLLKRRSRRRLARTGTNRRGHFRIKLRKRVRGKIRVVVRARKVNKRLVCKGGRSRFIRG